MNRIARVLAAVSVLAIVSACGSDSSNAGDGAGSQTTSSQDTSGDSSQVVSVSLHQTGGLKPTDEMRVFSDDKQPPAGFTQQDVDAAIAAADALAASDVKTPRLPQGVCADCYSYQIILTFADGSSTSYSVSGGVKQAKPLSDLLAALS